MAQLTFTGRSKDGKRLLLVDESGQVFTLALDARLRSVLTGVPERNGQLEIPMESSLRPRDIQTRIRAGESPEAVAHAAGTSVDKIMPYAAPVMAERDHMSRRAQLSSIRRRSGESGARTLGEAVAAHVRTHHIDPSTVEWDAWRREDGRWTLTGTWDMAGRNAVATFSYDPRGNFVTVDDEDARWLIGDATPVAEAAPSPDDLSVARRRRLSAVSTDDVPLGEDAIEMVAGDDEPSPSESTLDFGETSLGAEQPAGEPARQTDLEHEPQPDLSAEKPVETSTQPPAAKAKKRGRASVPSWDEIMFGGGKND